MATDLQEREPFLAGAAHELRTPVATLQAVIASAQAGDEDPGVALGRLATVVEGTAERVERLLVWSRLHEAGLEWEPVRLDLLVETCLHEGEVAELSPTVVHVDHRGRPRRAADPGSGRTRGVPRGSTQLAPALSWAQEGTMTRIAAWLSVPTGLLILGTACEIDAGAENGDPPSIVVTVGGHNLTTNEPTPEGVPCYELTDGPTRVNVVAADGGGLQRLFVHLMEGSVVDSSVDVQPDVTDISWLVAPGESPADIGDDTIDITLTRPTSGTVRNGVNVTFDLEGSTPFSLEMRASDFAGNENGIAPFVLHQVDVHGACP